MQRGRCTKTCKKGNNLKIVLNIDDLIHQIGYCCFVSMATRCPFLAMSFRMLFDDSNSLQIFSPCHVPGQCVISTPMGMPGNTFPFSLSGEDGRQTAGRCLGELVRKTGERFLPTIVPILKDGTESEDVATRQGVCLGLRELLDSLTRNQLTEHLTFLLPAIQASLCDSDPMVGVSPVFHEKIIVLPYEARQPWC